MIEATNSLVIEHLRHIRAVVDDTHERLGRVELRLSAVESHLGSLLLAEAGQSLEIDRSGLIASSVVSSW